MNINGKLILINADGIIKAIDNIMRELEKEGLVKIE